MHDPRRRPLGDDGRNVVRREMIGNNRGRHRDDKCRKHDGYVEELEVAQFVR